MSYFSTSILTGSPPPRAYWRLDETSGTVGHDATSYHTDGSFSGGITFGQPGAISGDPDSSIGLSGGAAFSLPPSLDVTTWSALSLEFWIKQSEGLWEQIVVTVDGSGITTYLDGVESSGSGGDPVLVSEDLSWVGSYQAGNLDEIVLYDVVLSPAEVQQHFLIGQFVLSGGFALFANGSGIASFDSFRVTHAPDPSAFLNRVGRATSSLVAWNANLPDGTDLTVETSIDNGLSWQAVSASGDAIDGITTPAAPILDRFVADTSADYARSNFGDAGDASGSWSWDTTNSRIVGTGGSHGSLLFSMELATADASIAADFDQADGSGLVANEQDASTCYFVQAWDASGTGMQNAVKLFKRAGGVNTQLGATATIDWPRGRYRRVILDIQAGVLTVSMDGSQLIQQTDGSPLAAGKAGLLLGTLARCVGLRLQEYGPDVSALSVSTRLTLTSADPTATPQVLDLQAFVASEDIDPGALIPDAKYLRTYVSDNIADLNTKSATTWTTIRPDKSVVFRQRTATPAPWILDSTNKTDLGLKKQGDLLVANLKLTTNGDLYRNRQILTGVQGTGTFSETRTGDGQTRTWNLSNPLAAAPTILLNGQQVLVGIKNVDTGRRYYWQPGSATIDQNSGETILQAADILSFPDYTGTFPTEVVRDNATAGTFPGTLSQAELAAIDHTSGIVENVVDASKLGLNVAGAEAYGDQLLAKYGNPEAITLSFDTLRKGLAPGQQLPVYVPEQGAVGAQLLISQVTTTATIAPSVPGGVLYRYSITATEGANLGSSWKLLSGLLK